MSQIRASSLTNLRGRAYKCLHCQGPSPCIGEKRRVESHVYKTHIPLERSPYFCKLCTFRCTAQEDLERHVSSFGPHKTRETEYREQNRDSDFNIETFLLKSTNPYYVTAADMQCMSVEESETVWQERRRHGQSTATFTTPVALNTPPPVRRQTGVCTPVQDGNIWDLMMGPTQYSSNMTITPTRPGMLTFPSTPVAPTQACVVPVPLSSGLSPVVTTTVLPSFSTILPPNLRLAQTTTVSAVSGLPSVMPSGIHPLFGSLMQAPSDNPTVVQCLPPMTLVQPQVHIQPPVMTSPTTVNTPVTTSPRSAIDTPYNPVHPTYTPTPIVRSQVRKIVKDDQANSNADIVKALNDINQTILNSMTDLHRAIENQTHLMGAINQQIKTYARNSEEDMKKRDIDDDSEEVMRRNKSKKHKKQ